MHTSGVVRCLGHHAHSHQRHWRSSVAPRGRERHSRLIVDVSPPQCFSRLAQGISEVEENTFLKLAFGRDWVGRIQRDPAHAAFNARMIETEQAPFLGPAAACLSHPLVTLVASDSEVDELAISARAVWRLVN
jgi:hypothetical protein